MAARKQPAEQEVDALRRRVAELEGQVSEFGRALEGFGRLSANVSSFFWVYEVDRERFSYLSPGCERVWHQSRRDLYKDPTAWMNSVHPEDRDRVLAAFEEVTRGRGVTIEHRVVRPGGEVRRVWGQGTPILDPDGVVRRVIGQVTDVTEQKEAEEALARSQRQFRRLLDSNIIGISLANVDGEITEANDAFLAMLGCRHEDLPLRWDEMTPSEWREADARAVEELMERGFVGPFEKQLFHRNGDRVPVIVGAALVDAERGDVIGVALDITARTRAEEAVRRASAELEIKVAERTTELDAARQRLQRIADSLPALIAYVDTDERYVFNNAAYETWFGIPSEEVRGRRIREVIGEKPYLALRPLIQRALAGETVTFDGELSSDDTGYFHIDLVPHFDAGGNVLGFHVLAQNLTEQKRTEQEFRRAERLASLGTLAAGIAHEINNPVGVILLAAEAGRTSPDDPPAMARAFRDIARNARRCATIVDNVLRFSRERNSPKRVQDLNRVIRLAWSMVREYADKHRVKVDFALSEDSPRVLMNPTEIEQVVVNLIQNSVQARAQRIEVRTAVDDRVRLSVKDDGEGIAPEHRSRMFEPFYTGRIREGGTGLGLSILHGIVRDHGGDIEVVEPSARGAHIRISFPCEVPTQ